MVTRVSQSCHIILSLCTLMLFSFLALRASADIWLSPKTSEAVSGNGKYLFRVVPSLGGAKRQRLFGNCRGMLYAKKGEELVLQWERPLVNDECPIDVRVSNSGKYVVTVGEWDYPEKLPLVVYDDRGRLINVYGKLEQILPDDWVTPKEISWSISGRHWIPHSLLFFDPSDEFFVVGFSNKTTLVFVTWSGELVDGRWIEDNSLFPERIKKYNNLKDNLKRLVVLEALRLASSKRPNERDKGQFVLSQCRDPESIRALQEAVEDQTSRVADMLQGRVREYPIRKAAKEALEARGEKVPGDVVLEEKLE